MKKSLGECDDIWLKTCAWYTYTVGGGDRTTDPLSDGQPALRPVLIKWGTRLTFHDLEPHQMGRCNVMLQVFAGWSLYWTQNIYVN